MGDKIERLSKAGFLRLKASRVEAEEALVAAKPKRKTCKECGQRVPPTAAQKKAVDKAKAEVSKIRRLERQHREEYPEVSV